VCVYVCVPLRVSAASASRNTRV